MVLYYWYLFFGLYPSSLLPRPPRPAQKKPLRFEGWLFARPHVKPTLLDPLDRASLYLWATVRIACLRTEI
jgi:hypothetical protein